MAEVNEYAQNAISNLLAPSIVRTGMIPHTSLPPSSQHRAPTVRDIPPVTLTSIPHVDNSVFKSYLKTVGSLYESFQRAKAANEEAAIVFGRDRKGSSSTDDTPDYFNRLPRRSSRSSLLSPRKEAAISSVPPTPSTPLSPRRLSNSRSQTSQPTPLSTIPNVYFDEDFRLENPRTFDVVSEKSEIIPQPLPAAGDIVNGSAPAPARRKALHTNAILQEKLSWYMDTVEVHLIQSIAAASASFFTALGSLKELQSEAADAVEQIRTLHNTLQELDKGMAVGGLEIARMKRKQENLKKLGQAVSQLCGIVQKAKSCEESVDQGKLDDASSGLGQLEKMIAGEAAADDDVGHQDLLDMRELQALHGLSDGILELRARIGRGYEGKFIQALLGDLRKHVQAVPDGSTLQRWANTSFRGRGGLVKPPSGAPAYMQVNEDLRPELVAALAGLSRAGHTARAAAAYREQILKEIKSLIRRHLPSSSDDDTESVTSVSTRGGRKLNQQEKSAILARNLRSLEPETAEDMLIKTFTAVGEALRRLGYQVKVLLDVTYSMELPKPTIGSPRASDPRSPRSGDTARDIGEEVTEALDLSSLLGQAVDLTQAQVVKVLRVRSEQSSRLPLEQFLRYFTLNRLFVDECEAISSRPGDALKEIINSHVREFLFQFAEAQRQNITQTLDADKWDAQEVSSATQTSLGHVLEGLNSTPRAWQQFVGLWDGSYAASTANGTSTTNSKSAAAEKTTHVSIDEQKYLLVTSAIAALRGMEAYLNLIAGIPSLTVDASQRLLDYLKVFNSRAVQLILGAGATRSAGLKNITTKHLALASQACSFVVALIPYAREFVRRQAPSAAANVLPEFDKVKRLFQDHQTSIHDKLVEIMSQRCAAHIRAFTQLALDDPADPAAPPSACVEALCKETGTLYRVLAKHVAELDLRLVMRPIFAHYHTEWARALTDAPVRTPAGKQRSVPPFLVHARPCPLTRLPDSSATCSSSTRASAKWTAPARSGPTSSPSRRPRPSRPRPTPWRPRCRRPRRRRPRRPSRFWARARLRRRRRPAMPERRGGGRTRGAVGERGCGCGLGGIEWDPV